MTDTARLGETVRDLLESGRHERLAQLLEEWHAADVAAALRDLAEPERITFFRLLNREQEGAVLAELDDQTLLGGLPIRWFDGRHNNWENTRDEVSPAPWP